MRDSQDWEGSFRRFAVIAVAPQKLMLNSKVEDDSLRFAVFHTAEMLMCLEKEYDASWHGERSKP
jgi:hypothetical protein